MTWQLRKNGTRSLACAIALAVVLPCASGILLPIVPLPISFNFGGASPMSMDVACSWGTIVEVDGAKQVRQGCGAARHSWKVVQEAGSGSGSEVALGPLASQQKLTLTLSPNRGQGAWRGTCSLVQQAAAPSHHLVLCIKRHKRQLERSCRGELLGFPGFHDASW
jgi:hypothetical protein